MIKFSCPRCLQVINLRDGACPGCGFSLTLGSVLGHYFHRCRSKLPKSPDVQCPNCHHAVPLSAKSCPACNTAITINSAIGSVLEPPRRRWHSLRSRIADASPEARRYIQWSYFVLSMALFWWSLHYTERHVDTGWIGPAILSVIFLAAIALLSVFLVPRHVFSAIARHASVIVKLSLIANSLALLVVMQIVISTWWARALTLAGLLAIITGAAYILCRHIWPLTTQVRGVFRQDGTGDFDPSAMQGRRGRHD